MRRGAVPLIFLCLSVVISSCGGGSEAIDDLVYEERFADLTTNGWTDTSDPVQFPAPPAGYSLTLDDGRYLATSSIQVANSPSCAAVMEDGDDLAAADPYKLRFTVAFPTSNAYIADSMVRFNYRKELSYEGYDYLALTSDGQYHVGHFDSIDAYYHYMTGWGFASSFKTDGTPNQVEIEQSATSFEISVNGSRICYAVNYHRLDQAGGFHVGIMRDGGDLASVGSVAAYYDDIELYE